jgi:hypothetical protein
VANHQIPRTARCIEDLTAPADDGRVAHLKAYEHTRAGHDRPEFYIVWYLDLPSGRIDRSTRVTQQYSGATGRARLDTELAASRKMFTAAAKRNGA